MRTKNLLLSAAALAAGIVSSSAQSNVYSVNIVGYVNKPLPSGALELIQNPLNDGTNTLNSTMFGLSSGSIAYVWNGSGYSSSTRGKAAWDPNLSVPTGLGYFVKRSGAVGTNTFVGSVVVGPGQSVTNPLTGGAIRLVGSAIPYADTLNGTNLGLASAPNGTILYKWNGSGYTSSTRGKAAWDPNLTINVGESFFIKPTSTFNWVQTLPSN
jgi:hypothetical protein